MKVFAAAVALLLCSCATVSDVVPAGGDRFRYLGHRVNDIAAMWAGVNRGKRSVCLDLQHPDGLGVMRELIAGADVLDRDALGLLAVSQAGVEERDDRVLDIGATSDRGYDHSNYFEAWYPYKANIVAAGISDAAFLEHEHPGLKFVQADGRSLPFADGSFDWVHSSAVLEHVGNAARQTDFVREMWRVSRKGIFLTTPDIRFPVEFHTVLPLIHWLPPALFRRALSKVGKGFYAREENLNLLSRGRLSRIAVAAGIVGARVTSAKLVGWPANLLLIAGRDRHG